METEILKSTKKQFSLLGLMYLIGSLLILGLQYGEIIIIDKVAPGFSTEHNSIYFLIVMLSMYAISMPLMLLLIKKFVPATAPTEADKKKMSFKQWISAFLIAYAGMYLSNIVGNIITSIIGAIKGAPVSNDILEIASSNSIWINVAVMVVLAPIFEELIFRKFLVDRTIKYGEGISILTSALFFGLFHGNLNQFAYAFVIGGIFAYVYIRTRNVKYTIFLHMLINFMGSVVSLLLLRVAGLDQLISGELTDPNEMMVYMMEHVTGLAIFGIYFLVLIALVIVGIVLFAKNMKTVQLAKTELTVPKGQRFKTYFVNLGMILFALYWVVTIVIQFMS